MKTCTCNQSHTKDESVAVSLLGCFNKSLQTADIIIEDCDISFELVEFSDFLYSQKA